MKSKNSQNKRIVAEDDAEVPDIKVESSDFFADLLSGPKEPRLTVPKQAKRSESKRQNPAPNDTPEILPATVAQPQKKESQNKLFDYEAWSALQIVKPILKAIDDLDYERPTKIQEKAIPMILSGKDVLGRSVTGSGKTAAYLIPIMQQVHRMKTAQPMIRALIVLPTRELALQGLEMFKDLNKYLRLTAAVVIGKTDLSAQESDLRRSPDIVFATPGRIIDLAMNSRGVYLDNLSYLVFDEADQLLNLGFKAEVEQIVSLVESDTLQTLLFSATLEKGVEKLIKLALRNPLRVEADPELTLSNTLRQEIIKLRTFASDDVRRAVTILLLKKLSYKRCIVFLKRKSDCHWMYLVCKMFKLPVVELHGDLSQLDRAQTVKQFNENECVMLATDLAARGLDFQNVDYVINLELPIELTRYIHRIGRTARAGCEGSCITLLSDQEMPEFKRFIKKSGEKAVSRKIDFQVVKTIEEKLVKLEPKIREKLRQERVDKELAAAEMEVNKAQNMLSHGEEIYSRPRREWFQGKEEKEEGQKIAREASQKKLQERFNKGTKRVKTE